jgi:hypothetical protein
MISAEPMVAHFLRQDFSGFVYNYSYLGVLLLVTSATKWDVHALAGSSFAVFSWEILLYESPCKHLNVHKASTSREEQYLKYIVLLVKGPPYLPLS